MAEDEVLAKILEADRLLEEARGEEAPSLVRHVTPPNDLALVKRFAEELKLPAPDKRRLSLDFYSVIVRRRSLRRFDPFKPVDLRTLSTLLYASVGKTLVVDGVYGMLDYPLRASPSAGGLHCVDLYVAVLRSEGLDPGIYYYNYVDHALAVVCRGCVPHSVTEAVGQPALTLAPAYLIYVANLRRGLWKYGTRFYKHCLVDAGAVAENAHLAATAMGLSSVFVAGFARDAITRSLLLSKYEMPVVLLAVGRGAGAEQHT